MGAQADLFANPTPESGGPASRGRLPEGFAYAQEWLGPAQQQELIARISRLDLQPFEFQGWLGRRRVAYFGWSYDFARGRAEPAAPFPSFLLPLRQGAAAFAGVETEAFVHALVSAYPAGAGIGWHRDRPQFGVVAGVSLGSACPLRLRLRTPGGFERAQLMLAPGSIYRLDGPARWSWEHSIAPVTEPRWSITFRTLKP